MRRAAVAVRTLAQALGIAAFGALAALAAGAVTIAGMDLLLPGSLGIGSPLDALGHAARFALASLRVDVTSPGVTETVAPLSGAAVSFWAIASSVRTRQWAAGAPSLPVVAAVACSCAGAGALAAALTREGGTGAVPGGAALHALVWGLAAAAAGRTLAGRDARFTAEADAGAVAAPDPSARSLRALLAAGTGLPAVWLLAAGAASFATGALDARGVAGAGLLAVAFFPNIAAVLVTLGCGGRAELAFAGDGRSPLTLDGTALWDWGGGLAPWYVLVLVAVPLVATVAAAAASPAEPALRRGLRNGFVLGSALLLLGWAGPYEATAEGPGGATIRFGVDPVVAALLGVAWGVAGSILARWMPRRARRPRLGPP